MATTTTNLVGHLSVTGQNAFAKGMHIAGQSVKRFAQGVAVAGAAAGAFAVKSVQTASDIDESLSKNRVLFGKYAKDVVAFAGTTATSFGVSKREALEATGTFGNLFTALEIAPKTAAKMSISLTKLAADMASFNNASPEDTLLAIRSGLAGETEPLRRFGVNLNDATLRAEALRKGLVKSTKEALTPQQKALTVVSLLFKQTSKAQGDFARTSKGLANQQRILKARFSDLSAQLSAKLLPIAVKAAGALNDMFTPASKKLDELLKKAAVLRPRLQQLGKRLGVLFRGDKLEPKRTRSPGAARRADSEPVATRSPGAARRADSAPSRERELSGLESFAKRAGHIFRVVRQFTRETFPPLRDAVKEAGRTLVDSFAPAMPFLRNVLLPLVVAVGKGVVGALVVGFRLLVPVLRVAAGAIKVVATVLGWVGERARPLRGWVDKLGVALGVVSKGPMLLMAVAARAGAGALKFFAGAVRGIAGVVGKVLGKLASFVGFVKSIPSKIAGVGVKIVEGIANGIKGAPGALLDALKSVVSSALDALPGGIGKAAGKVLGIDGMRKGGRARYTGPHIVGEDGVEVVNLNRGDHVTPNARLGAAPRVLAGGAAFLTVPIVVELDGRQVGRGMGRIALQDLARA